MTRLWTACIAVLACGLVVPASAQSPGSPVRDAGAVEELSGTLTYRERITLPDGARVHLTLFDRNRADGKPVATHDFKVRGNVPLAFRFPLPASGLAADGDYFLYAQIVVAERPWFSNTVTPLRINPAAIPSEIEILLRNDMRPL